MEGFAPKEVAALEALARVAKLADNAENMDLSRIYRPTPADHARLEEYERVRAVLLAAGGASRDPAD